MKRFVLTAAFAALTSAAAAQERGTRAPDTDKTVPIPKESRLLVNNQAGEVVIRTWDRDQLRVRARHNSRVTIDIQTTGNVVSVRARGPQAGVDYEITAPGWLPIKVSGQAVYVGIEGAKSEVSAETNNGDIVIKGGSGIVSAKSIQGEVIVEDTKGRIHASSINEQVRITGAVGDVVAETTNDDITLTNVEARSLDVSSVNGELRFEGSFKGAGPYRFSAHNGDITLTIPENTNATFIVRTYNGEFQRGGFPVKTVGELRRGRAQTYVLGNGGPEIELESFSGDVRLRRPGTAPRGRDNKDK